MLASIHYVDDHFDFPTVDVIHLVKSGNKYLLQRIDADEQLRRFQLQFGWSEQAEAASRQAGDSIGDFFNGNFPHVLELAQRFHLPFADTMQSWQNDWERHIPAGPRKIKR